MVTEKRTSDLKTKSPSLGEVGKAHKILIIQQKMIGDVLTSSILFEALKKKFPKAELHYLIYHQTEAVVKNNPFIDKIIFFNKKELTLFRLIRFLILIRKERYNVVIDVYSKIGSAIITAISGAKIKISYKKWYTKLLYTYVLSRKITTQTNGGQAIEKRMRLLSPLSGDFPKEIKPKIYLNPTEKEEAGKLLQSYGIENDTLIMVSVLGSSRQKTYPLRYLAILLDYIVLNCDAKLLFNYIPSQYKDAKNVLELCAPETKKRVYLEVFGKNLEGFMALTSFCRALIGNEGGAVNIAKALNVPTFAIFSPSQEKSNWNIYEDGIKNIAVHLNDYFPEKFENSRKKISYAENEHLYGLFKPELIYPKLEKFIKINLQ